MTWNPQQVKDRLSRNRQSIETDIVGLNAKAQADASYKGFHDRQLGALAVNEVLSNSDVFTTHALFLDQLKTMLADGMRHEMAGAFKPSNVALGWADELKALVQKYS